MRLFHRLLGSCVALIFLPFTIKAVEIQIVAATSTQAILRYEAPNTQACNVAVSEDVAFSSLVNDVNPQLFPGSNLDSRAGSIAGGTQRIVVVGKRTADRGANQKYYSRALQAVTKHYVQVRCGSDTANAQFTTANIPIGNTASEPLPVDRSRPGEYAWPTLDATPRDSLPGFVSQERIIDPGTGMLIRRLSIPNDVLRHQPFWEYASGSPMCSQDKVADANGETGYYCMIPFSDFGQSVLYWINSRTGESRYLHALFLPGQSGTDGWPAGWCNTRHSTFEAGNPRVFYCAREQALVRVEYAGSNAAQPGSDDAGQSMRSCENSPAPCFRMTNITPASRKGDIGSQARQFDSRFDDTKFGCFFIGLQGTHAIYDCPRGRLDSIAWIVVLDVKKASPVCSEGSNCVIAATPGWAEGTRRWCGTNYVYEITGGSGSLIVAPSFAFGGTNGLGDGPYASSIVSGPVTGASTPCPANPFDAQNCLTITVDGEPRDLTPVGGETGAPGELMAAQPGDYFRIASPRGVPWYAERVRLIQKDGNKWTLQRAIGFTQAQSFEEASPTLFTFCANFRPQEDAELNWIWNYANDPHGDNKNGQTVQKEAISFHNASTGWQAIAGTGYSSDCAGLRGGCVAVRYGQPAYNATTQPNARIEMGVTFADTGQDGIRADSYTTWTQWMAPESEKHWVLDAKPYLQNFSQNAVTQVSGSLYKVAGAPLARKRIPTEAFTGTRPLMDVSGSYSQIGDGREDNYKYCVALVAGECRPDSDPGDFYANVVDLALKSCTSGHSVYATPQRDLCVNNHNFSLNELTQYGFEVGRDTSATLHARVLTRMLNAYRSGWYSSRTLPDASWVFWNSGTPDSRNTNLFLGKVPPFPESDDVNRNTFIPVRVDIPAMEGAPRAQVEFGYAEEGDPQSHFCTSRREACLVSSDFLNEFEPFNFWSEFDYFPARCPRGCTVTIPALPQRIVYFRVVYMSDNLEEIATGPKGVAMEGKVTFLP